MINKKLINGIRKVNCPAFRAGRVLSAVAFCLSLLLFGTPLFSQGNAGTISGTVTDQTGGTLEGAKVTVTDVQRGAARTLTTDSAGSYSAPNLTPSTYTVRVDYTGFKGVVRNNVTLETSGSV